MESLAQVPCRKQRPEMSLGCRCAFVFFLRVYRAYDLGVLSFFLRARVYRV